MNKILIKNLLNRTLSLLNKRFRSNGTLEKLGNFKIIDHVYDAIVIGSGGAGLRTALSLSSSGYKTAVISKSSPFTSTTVSAQGEMSATLDTDQEQEDKWQNHALDTLKGSDWIADQDAVHYMTKNASNEIRELSKMGIGFPVKDGKLEQTRFGLSKYTRGCGVADRTGYALVQTLLNQIYKQNTKTDFFINHFALDLRLDENKHNCHGVIVLSLEDGAFHRFKAKNTILSTGGYTRMYESTTVPAACTGDGSAMITRAGLLNQDMEFVQFHPTGLYGTGHFISGTVRSQGAYFINGNGERFMLKYDPKNKDLTSRDNLNKCIMKEINEGRGAGPNRDHVLLKIDSKTKELYTQAAKTFQNIDPKSEPIPVIPTAHYCMGGILTNYKGQVLNRDDTLVHGLYACGEAACVSVHGANRLGGNSLTELVVFGKACALNIKETSKPGEVTPDLDKDTDTQLSIQNVQNILKPKEERCQIPAMKSQLQTIVQRSVGVLRNGETLDEAYRQLKHLFEMQNHVEVNQKNLKWNGDLVDALELQNMLLNAVQVVYAAKERRETRGSHFRQDFTDRIDELDYNKPIEGQTERQFDKHFRKHSITQADPKTGNVQLSYRPVVDTTLDSNELKPVKPMAMRRLQ